MPLNHSPFVMLNYVALGLLIFVALFLFYAIIIIHDIPYEIAKKRKHPHQDAIHVAGWVSLLTLHVIWPFLWIWATLYREDRGWGMSRSGLTADDLEEAKKKLREDEANSSSERPDQLSLLQDRIAVLEATLKSKESNSQA